MTEERCPWNPFPPHSAWGLMFDEMYRRDRARERIRARLAAMTKGSER